MKLNVVTLDLQIKFLEEQAKRLEDLAARPGNSWAQRNADQMRGIKKLLEDLRREQQMTTMSGKPIE